MFAMALSLVSHHERREGIVSPQQLRSLVAAEASRHGLVLEVAFRKDGKTPRKRTVIINGMRCGIFRSGSLFRSQRDGLAYSRWAVCRSRLRRLERAIIVQHYPGTVRCWIVPARSIIDMLEGEAGMFYLPTVFTSQSGWWRYADAWHLLR